MLNRQEKLFAHLNPDYLRNILTVGGRYACGNPNSIMPVWSNTGNPPGPAQLQADRVPHRVHPGPEGRETYRVMDPSLFEPVVDPATGEEKTFEGWVDPNYAARAGRDAVPGLLVQTRSRRPRRRPPRRPPRRVGRPGARRPRRVRRPRPARSQASPRSTSPFDKTELSAPADDAVPDRVRQPGRRHPAQRRDQGRRRRAACSRARSSTASPPRPTTSRRSPRAPTPFVCTVHPNMTGTLKVGG